MHDPVPLVQGSPPWMRVQSLSHAEGRRTEKGILTQGEQGEQGEQTGPVSFLCSPCSPRVGKSRYLTKLLSSRGAQEPDAER
jgi:hypothetical protein